MIQCSHFVVIQCSNFVVIQCLNFVVICLVGQRKSPLYCWVTMPRPDILTSTWQPRAWWETRWTWPKRWPLALASSALSGSSWDPGEPWLLKAPWWNHPADPGKALGQTRGQTKRADRLSKYCTVDQQGRGESTVPATEKRKLGSFLYTLTVYKSCFNPFVLKKVHSPNLLREMYKWGNENWQCNHLSTE